MQTRTQRGFTMIELIVVIVILGVLAAVALPRFTNLQRDARIAKLNAARGAVAAASAQIHGAALARLGQPAAPCAAFGNAQATAAAGNVCTESGLVPLTNLYPAGALNGVITAAGLVPINAVPTPAQLAAEGYGAAAAGGVVTVSVVGGSGVCSFTYTAAAANTAPALSAVTTTGC